MLCFDLPLEKPIPDAISLAYWDQVLEINDRNLQYVEIDGQIYYKANSVAREEDEEEDAVEDGRDLALADEEDVRRNLYGS